ncbi:MAG TPA: hypothetical protein VKA46_02700 [Gemmataceae bacterium]|nr:hypothetical protein [Gemmataceae bacterium]
MTAVILSIPDDPDAIPGWLERQLLGPDLERLVRELSVLHPAPADPPTLPEAIGGYREEILHSGLAAVPRPVLSLLLRTPALLPELQELVFTQGGSYWDEVSADPDLTARADRVVRRVRRVLEANPGAPPARRRGRWLIGHAVTALAAAAAVLAALYLGGWRPQPPPPPPKTTSGPGWGFTKIEQLPRDGGDTAVLRRLADLAAEWSNQRPDDVAGLDRRLIEFRAGCSALLLADDLPLSPENRKWLRLRCEDWAAAIDGHLRTLEETRDAVAVRAAADSTVRQIVAELRARAAS